MYPSPATRLCKLYCCIISGGKYLNLIFMYSASAIGEAKKKSFKSVLINLAPCLASDITLLSKIFVSRSEAAGDEASFS